MVTSVFDETGAKMISAMRRIFYMQNFFFVAKVYLSLANVLFSLQTKFFKLPDELVP